MSREKELYEEVWKDISSHSCPERDEIRSLTTIQNSLRAFHSTNHIFGEMGSRIVVRYGVSAFTPQRHIAETENEQHYRIITSDEILLNEIDRYYDNWRSLKISLPG